jgi:acetyl esterase/lipase
MTKVLNMAESAGQPISPALTAREYLEKALAWSASVRRETRCLLNVSFGTDERQKLDVYLPGDTGAAGMPVLVFFHGGYWVLGHKDTLGFMAPPITLAPAILVTGGYRLAPAAKYPAQVDDCRSVLKWTFENIAQFGGDPDRIFVGGHSAGGHLASLITLQRGHLAEFKLPRDIIKGCFPVSGVFDVSDSPLERQEALLSSPDQAREASPLYNTAGNSVPFFLEIGGNDFPNLRVQHPAIIKALKSEAGRVEEMERLGHNHFEISLDHGDLSNPWSRKVVEWLIDPPT